MRSVKNILSLDNQFNPRTMHLFLNRSYYNFLFNEDVSAQLTPQQLAQFRKLEKEWIDHEVKLCLEKYNCNIKVKDVEMVVREMKKHPVFNHPIFNLLSSEATLSDLKTFILNDSILNIEFFDYLALAIIGVTGKAKSEIAANLWDEAGRGKVENSHTVLFKKFLNELNLNYDRSNIIEQMSCEGLAGINLFSHLSLYSYNKIKYFGLLAATEMLDPPHYHKLIKGINRIFNNKLEHTYYAEHELIDIEHANGWLRNVVIPELAKNPAKTTDFWLGFYLRLDSAKRYYDSMLTSLLSKQAA